MAKLFKFLHDDGIPAEEMTSCSTAAASGQKYVKAHYFESLPMEYGYFIDKTKMLSVKHYFLMTFLGR